MTAVSGAPTEAAPRPAAVTPSASPRIDVLLQRIHIAGGPGAGKTTLARRLAALTGLPVHHLDDVARVGGGTGRVRDAAERAPLVDAILAEDGWITDGVHLGWTEPILARAQLIAWLDIAEGPAAARIGGRFLDGAWAEFTRRSWRQRVAATPGYARHARDAVVAMRDARRYARAAAAGPDGALPPPVDRDGTLDSRAATEAALAPHADRVVRCRTFADVDALVARLEAAIARPAAAATTIAAAPGAPGR